MNLALYKIRDDLEDGDWGLRTSAADYKPVPVRSMSGVKLSLYVRTPKPSIPRWQKELLSIAADQGSRLLRELQNQSTGALLLIERRGHRFVLVYGSGRHAVDSTKIETGFGLRVAANVIDPESLKGVDTRSIIGSGRSQAVSMPSAGPLHRLGIEPTADLVRYLEGRPSTELATGIAGGDVLRLTLKSFSLNSLAEKIDEIVAAYDSVAYKESFPFLDYFVRVPRSNSELRSRLNAEVGKLLLEGSDNLDLMNPEIDRAGRPERFVLKYGRKTLELGEVSTESVSEVVSKWGVADPLSALKVNVFYEDVEVPRSIPLLHFVAAEIELDGRLFAPCSGVWYRVDGDHLASMNERISLLTDLTGVLPFGVWHRGYKREEDYNKHALPSGSKHMVLDKALFYSKGGRNQKVEVCDLITAEKQLICVKKMVDSATLSHLFAQGAVSAQLLKDNRTYRDVVLGHLRRIDPNAAIGSFSDWTIVFAVATDRPGSLAKSLFFFSKVNLEIAVRAIHGTQMRVALAKIDHE
ncbi:DUF6119 family protein [Micromonospora carbonacea]|uniref:DUF6119 family protein n=1 Tax=Micromonospora carbonacea TaxID=47853 RepID=UPI00331DD7B5